MSLFFFILGGLFKTHPPDVESQHASKASIAMAVMIYLYGVHHSYLKPQRFTDVAPF